jgi:hypothetical protein
MALVHYQTDQERHEERRRLSQIAAAAAAEAEQADRRAAISSAAAAAAAAVENDDDAMDVDTEAAEGKQMSLQITCYILCRKYVLLHAFMACSESLLLSATV